MKAVEMRKSALQPQYESILAKHEEDLQQGDQLASTFKFIYPEVVQMLLEEGFDVEQFVNGNGETEVFVVSSRYAEEGQKGVFTKKTSPSLGDFFEDVVLPSLFGTSADEEDEPDETPFPCEEDEE